MKTRSRAAALLLALLTAISLLTGCGGTVPAAPAAPAAPTPPPLLLLTDPPAEAANVPDAETPSPTAEATPEPTAEPTSEPTEAPTEAPIAEDGEYDNAEDVALYLHTYGHLPGNYISKKQAEKLGWNGGGLDNYAYGKCIGGDFFGNYSGDLPSAKGRRYSECDIGTLHARSRGAKRLIYSNDGLIFYTEDHYETFTQLY